MVPLNLTVLRTCDEPKLLPVIVTAVPTMPEFRDRLLITGDGKTVNGMVLLATPLTVTTTLPEVAPDGTGA
jgi:hypothetical protein